MLENSLHSPFHIHKLGKAQSTNTWTYECECWLKYLQRQFNTENFSVCNLYLYMHSMYASANADNFIQFFLLRVMLSSLEFYLEFSNGICELNSALLILRNSIREWVNASVHLVHFWEPNSIVLCSLVLHVWYMLFFGSCKHKCKITTNVVKTKPMHLPEFERLYFVGR